MRQKQCPKFNYITEVIWQVKLQTSFTNDKSEGIVNLDI